MSQAERIGTVRIVNEYDRQAKKFLDDHKLTLSVTAYPEDCQVAPKWTRDVKPVYTAVGPMTHGLRYRVTVRRTGETARLSFDFWDSIKNAEAIELAKMEGRIMPPRDSRPTAYSVLACLSSDSYPCDSFKNWAAEYGYSDDSIKAKKLWKRCRSFANRIVAFFSEPELESLRRIQ